jgi:3-hydroxyisobutyrate dehydrogenase
MKTPVAILGLGIMGSGMARRLVSSGFPLSVYSRSQEKAAPFAELGAYLADSPRQAAERADVVISMVSDDTASRAVWMGDAGALAGARSGSVLIECSTLTVGWIKELAEASSQRDREFLDAPVTGTKPHAESGQLLFLVGGTTLRPGELPSKDSMSGWLTARLMRKTNGKVFESGTNPLR